LSAAAEATVEDLLPQVYADVTEAQLVPARSSLWAHLRFLAGEGRAEASAEPPGQDTIKSRWCWMVPA
jgi:hypothetical protein